MNLDTNQVDFLAPKSSFLCAMLFAVHPIHTECVSIYEIMTRTPAFAYMRKHALISCAVNAQLISAFVSAQKIVQSLYMYLLNSNFQDSSHLMWLHSHIFVSDQGLVTIPWSDLLENPVDRRSYKLEYPYRK